MIGVLLSLIQDEARRIWCYRALAAVTALVIFCAAAIYIQRLPNLYDAWGQIYVNKQTPLAVAAEGVSLVGENYGSPYVVQKTLLNDQNLEKVVRGTNPAAALMTKAQIATAIAQLRNKIHVAPDQGDGFVEFHYVDSDPVKARDMVQLLLNQFISRNVSRSRTDLGEAERFLDDQITSYSAMIAQSQAKMAAFRSRHPSVGRPAGDAGTEEVVLAAEPGAPVAAAPARPTAAAERVNALEGKLASLLMVYTDQYPDVVSTRRQLADAITTRDREASQAAAAAAADPAPTQVTQAPTRYVQRIRRRAAPVVPPQVAAEWADLQRNDEVLRINYQQLIGRREAARMSQAVYGSDGSGKYQVTRTPVTPAFPIGPKRGLYLALAAVAAIGGGLGVAYVRAAMKGIMVSPRELELACQLPVVGTVSWEPAWATGKTRPSLTSIFRSLRPAVLGMASGPKK